MAINQPRMTHQEFNTFLADNPNGLYELINGQIVQKMPTERHGEIAGIVFSIIYAYLRAQDERLGRVSVESRFRPKDDSYNDMLPDVAFRRTDGKAVNKGAVSGVPDLAVEIKSPDDQINMMREKAKIYLRNGSQMVWLIYPNLEIVEVYTPNADVLILQNADTLTGGDVLPNFSTKLADIFEE